MVVADLFLSAEELEELEEDRDDPLSLEDELDEEEDDDERDELLLESSSELDLFLLLTFFSLSLLLRSDSELDDLERAMIYTRFSGCIN